MTNQVSLEEVRIIAELAKLDLTDEEISRYAGQLSKLLDYFQLLQQVDTSHIETLDAQSAGVNILREDTAKPALSSEEVISNAPEAQNNQFLVSPVLDNE